MQVIPRRAPDAARSMNELYKMGEVSGQLEADAAKLRGYANEPDLKPTLTMEKMA